MTGGVAGMDIARGGRGLMRVAAVLICAAPTTALAGAWPQPEGEGQVISQVTYYQAQTQGFDGQGRPVGSGRYQQTEFSPYVEYGLTPDWTIGGQPRMQDVVNTSNGQSTSSAGLAEFNVFVRYLVWQGPNDVVSLQGTAGMPGWATNTSPEVAYPHAEYELRVLYGHGVAFNNGMTGFAEVDMAGRARTGPDASEAHLDITAGIRPQPQWLLMAQSFSTLGLRNNAPGGADYSVTKLQLSVVYDFTDRWSVQLGAYHEIAGRNVALGNAGIAALWYRF